MGEIKRKPRPKIKQGTKIRSILQQEIDSACPMPKCDSKDVGHFEIHHIDENRENNLTENLLLVCPTCHSKITKGDISQEAVRQIKKQLPVKRQIECASIAIDEKNCSWESYDSIPFAFIQTDTSKSPFPILSFSLINHFQKTILLKEIQLKVKHLPSGLSGIPRPSLLKSTARFKIQIPKGDNTTKYKLEEELTVPSGQAFKFQVLLYSKWKDEYFSIDTRKALYFTFKFNNDILVSPPTICLNCRNENEKMKIMLLD